MRLFCRRKQLHQRYTNTPFLFCFLFSGFPLEMPSLNSSAGFILENPSQYWHNPTLKKERSDGPITNMFSMPLNSTRLVHIFTETVPQSPKTHQQNVIDRISDIPSVFDTISLSAAHGTYSAAGFGPANIPIETTDRIREDFFETRALLVRSVEMSFNPKFRRMANPLPTPERVHSHLGTVDTPGALVSQAFVPFRKFYTARQKEIAIGIQRFRSRHWDMIASLSGEFACLIELDKSFSSIFAKYARDCFSVVPDLLERQFGVLLDEQRRQLPEKISLTDLKRWTIPNDWIFDFHQKMRETLLAELDARLLPTRGVIESLPHDN